jgi:hypothetical protein
MGTARGIRSDSSWHVVDLQLTMIKKRSRPQARIREISPEAEEASNSEAGETGGEEKLE